MGERGTLAAMSPRPVVAAAIVDRSSGEPRILAASRAYPEQLRGQFELPGGKIEPNEPASSALLREIREELGCELTLGRQVLSDYEDGAWPILGGRVMYVWLAEAVTQPRVGTDHLEFKWVSHGDYELLDWLKPNIPIVAEAFNMLELTGK